MKAAIYVRVSTADQHVESQLYDLRELAARRSFEVVKVYQDCGVSGRRARRAGLDALMADARQHKFAVVLVAAFDRVARSTRHFLQVVDDLDSLGIAFISRREGINVRRDDRLRLLLSDSHAAVSCSVSRRRARSWFFGNPSQEA